MALTVLTSLLLCRGSPRHVILLPAKPDIQSLSQNSRYAICCLIFLPQTYGQKLNYTCSLFAENFNINYAVASTINIYFNPYGYDNHAVIKIPLQSNFLSYIQSVSEDC